VFYTKTVSFFTTALSSKNRIRKNTDFEFIFKKGQKRDSFSFYIRFLPNKSEITRFGIVVSPKIFKRAVVRNRIKRRISEICRKKIEDIKKGYDIVLIIKSPALNRNIQELTEDFFKVFKKANLLN